EEVLGVEDDLVHPGAQERDRVADDVEVLLQRDAQVVPDMEIPRLADDGDDRCLGAQQCLQVAVVRGAHARAAGGTERGDTCRPEPEPANAAEELLVARIRARPAAFHVVDAQVVEALGDAELVVEREADVFGLRAVAQRRVVELDLPHQPGAMNSSCSARTASSAYFASTTTEILISEVEIIWMLMLSRA